MLYNGIIRTNIDFIGRILCQSLEQIPHIHTYIHTYIRPESAVKRGGAFVADKDFSTYLTTRDSYA